MLTNFNARVSHVENISTPVSIEVSDVAVKYMMPNERVNSLKEAAIRQVTGRKVSYNEFLALYKINLKVHRGEAVALIGRNGAGKSTLLKVISQVQRPTNGRIVVRGKISPMIELGAGFHPELTGRENVFLNGAMLGFSRKQMEQKFDEIVDFSELSNFIDSPIRTYSTGMIARLGFSIASAIDPEILIIDEVLSVGDENFQQKCMNRMRSFRDRGITILFVTHGLDSISQLCPRSVWINAGRIHYDGPTEKTVQYFKESMAIGESLSETRMNQIILPSKKGMSRK